ncbi:hypothetical protein CsSME_00011399 [Camellia sinensis var. sinensis]
MLMVQEWWKWLENEQQQLSGSWRVCSWVRSAIDYVRAHCSEAFTLSHLTTNSPASQGEGHSQACYQPCYSVVYDLGNGKGVPYALATLLSSSRDRCSKLMAARQSTYATWAPLQLGCFGSLFPSATPGGDETESTWNGGAKTKCLRNLVIAIVASAT